MRAAAGAIAIGYALMVTQSGAAQTPPPVDLTRQGAMAPPAPVPRATSSAPAFAPPTDTVGAPSVAMPQPVVPPPPPHWSIDDAQALLTQIKAISREGLFARDYEPAGLAAAITAGEGPALDQTATRLFTWVAEDLRDGRTPMDARVQWFVVDPDADEHPIRPLLEGALASHDIAGAFASLEPTTPDYAELREALANARTPAEAALIRVNMDRWRWLGRDLGLIHLEVNVPEQILRLAVRDKIITTYRAIVGKPGRTATPQLSATVQNVVFNPTWTVPQSIVKGEGLGAKLLASPASAARQNYKVTKTESGMVIVVQQPGKGNALGVMKLDMPNPHAIYIHDTPNRSLFNLTSRALSHGCIRAERADELGMTMAMLGADISKEQGIEYTHSGKYTKVPMTQTFPVYITYFTIARDVNGLMRNFADIYGRDAPVLASFAAPRQLHTGQRVSKEAVVKLDNPL
jgi:murein L,D-transpeptidase YcbB/YkuD